MRNQNVGFKDTTMKKYGEWIFDIVEEKAKITAKALMKAAGVDYAK